ncbi:hypothetical protein [Myceligenerans crystallogenes]|uniref:Flp pilus assembly protein TadB n=1 Tax=Myceligenerans crystallogenes TaxID=316335 RepID=A0ABN2NLB1_9MICO
MIGLVGFMICGAILMLGLTLGAVYLFAPTRVDAAATLNTLVPPRTVHRAPEAPRPPSDATERLGTWAQRVLPDVTWTRVPYRELALLRIPVTRFYGRKITAAVGGLVIVLLASLIFTTLGVSVPVPITMLAGAGLAGMLFFGPHYDVARAAKTARAEFRRELASYVDAVAVERASGSGVRQAMERAAALGDHWVWRRLAEELARSRWSGVPPWDALEDLSDELTLPQLREITDVLRLAGEEGAAAWDTLRARTVAMRQAMLTEDQAVANADVQRMAIPAALLGCMFLALLIAPLLLRIFTRT